MPQLANSNHAVEKVAQTCKESLEELHLDYLDLFLMHWPVTGNKGSTVEPPIKVSSLSACLLARQTRNGVLNLS